MASERAREHSGLGPGPCPGSFLARGLTGGGDAVYIVAAIAQELGPPEPAPHKSATVRRMMPVGVRHAVPERIGFSRPLVALCGTDVEGWFTFPGVVFTAAHAGSCQRCGQLALPGVTRRIRLTPDPPSQAQRR